MSKPDGARILIVEDEWMIAEVLVDAVEEAGYSVVGPASCVKDALLLISGEAPRVALLDVNLGRELVYDIAERLAALDVPFIFMTGYSSANLPAAYRDRPIITKPVALDNVVARIAAALEGRV